MRHGKKFNHLSRTTSHRAAMLSNMATSLIMEKRISTTVAKAKALRKYVEPLITKAKTDSTHSRRVVFSYLQNKESVQTLFHEVADKIAARPGGYTRILKTGNRLGDNADMCIIELVDFNEAMLTDAKADKSKTRRGRRKSTAKATPPVADAAVETVAAADVVEDVAVEEVAEAEVVEEVATAEVVEDIVDEVVAEEVVEEATAEAVVEDVAEEAAEEEATEEEPPAEDNEEEKEK
jgi:large subunit ribosomal protein L17